MNSTVANRLLLLAAVLFLRVAHASGVTSAMPSFYTPGTAFDVTLTAAPDAGTHVYAIEETPPTNWVVGVVSHGGLFDTATGKIKWGPFADATSRVLTYRVTPTAVASGTNTFFGRAMFDSEPVVVAGVRSIAKFPGTVSRSVASEYLPGVPLPVTLAAAPAADVAAWAAEENIPAGWTVSAISHGGVFDGANSKVKWGPFFDSSPRSLAYTLEPPSAARADVQLTAQCRFDAATVVDTTALPLKPGRLVRSAPATYRPGIAFAVTLTASPAIYMRTMAVEESLPEGWTPVSIGAGGVWDAANRKLKWGPFLGSGVAETTLGYQLNPADAEARPLALSATARFDDAEVTSSATVSRFLVHSENSVTRDLPAEYRPGAALTVTLSATPIDTGLVYGIEETVPTNWVVSTISHGGSFDPFNRLVKWGPFFDATATPRELSYQATPPTNAFGQVTFSGTARFDREVLPVGGDASLANAPGTVVRALPARYVSGQPFTVTLTATPVPGVETYAVEEQVPDGWTVGTMSDGGAYDSINRKLKWGPFLDRDIRPLTYTVTPPPAATGTNAFLGEGWFNGVESPVTGTSHLGRDRPPLAIPDSAGRQAGSSLKISVFKLLANDSDADGDFLQVLSVSSLSGHGGVVQLEWPWIYYTPPSGYDGVDTLSYTISDGFGGTATATVTIIIDSNNGDPARNIIALDILPDGHPRVRFTGVPGFVYHIETSPDASTWSRVGDRTADSLGQFEYIDPVPTAEPLKFYRSVWP